MLYYLGFVENCECAVCIWLWLLVQSKACKILLLYASGAIAPVELLAGYWTFTTLFEGK